MALGGFCSAEPGAVMAGAVSQPAQKRLYALFLLVVAVDLLAGPRIRPRAAPRPRSNPSPSRPAAEISTLKWSTDRPIYLGRSTRHIRPGRARQIRANPRSDRWVLPKHSASPPRPGS